MLTASSAAEEVTLDGFLYELSESDVMNDMIWQGSCSKQAVRKSGIVVPTICIESHGCREEMYHIATSSANRMM